MPAAVGVARAVDVERGGRLYAEARVACHEERGDGGHNANAAAPESTFFVGSVQSLQEPGFVPRKGSTAEGDGYIMGIASNYAEMASELHIVDARRMEEGAVAVVKLPFRLRSGTHVNWFSSDDLETQKAETA